MLKEKHMIDDSHKVAYEIWLLIQRTSYDIRRLREYDLRMSAGITISQAAALRALTTVKQAITPTELSRILHRAPHTIHELINRMEREGLVRKVKLSPWKRKTFIEVTEHGKEMHHKTKSLDVVYDVIASLSPNKQKSLEDCLQTLRKKALTDLADIKSDDL
ncbi:MarR family winged helix-turn-helix transcriptional regulator [Chloroflexota bacterium]